MCGWLVKAMLSRLRLARFILTISKWWWDLFCLVYFQGSLWLEFIQWFVAAIVLLYLFDLTSCWKYCIIAFLCPFQTPFIGEMCVIVVTTILNIPLDSYLKIVHLEEKVFVKKFFLLLNSSLMMSLRAGALKVSRGPNAISREEVSMATLQAETTPRAATNRYRHTE